MQLTTTSRVFRGITWVALLVLAISNLSFVRDEWKAISNSELKRIFKEIEQTYEKNQNYTVDIEHISYENHLTQIESQRIKGYYKRAGVCSHEYIVGVHTIQNSSFRIVVNDEEKTILIASPIKNKYTGTEFMDENTMNAALKSIKQCTVGDQTMLRLEFNPGPYLSSYELLVNKDRTIARIKMFIDNEVKINPEAENSPKTKPRLEIIYSNYKIGAKTDKSHFDEKKYFTEIKNKLIKSDSYVDFELIDTRIKK